MLAEERTQALPAVYGTQGGDLLFGGGLPMWLREKYPDPNVGLIIENMATLA